MTAQQEEPAVEDTAANWGGIAPEWEASPLRLELRSQLRKGLGLPELEPDSQSVPGPDGYSLSGDAASLEAAENEGWHVES